MNRCHSVFFCAFLVVVTFFSNAMEETINDPREAAIKSLFFLSARLVVANFFSLSKKSSEQIAHLFNKENNSKYNDIWNILISAYPYIDLILSGNTYCKLTDNTLFENIKKPAPIQKIYYMKKIKTLVISKNDNDLVNISMIPQLKKLCICENSNSRLAFKITASVSCLKYLSLHNCCLTDQSPALLSISHFTRLKSLNLCDNLISFTNEKIVKAFSLLKNIVMLNLSRNHIRIFPHALRTLATLTELDLSDNKLTTLSSGVCHLYKLKILNLENNHTLFEHQEGISVLKKEVEQEINLLAEKSCKIII